MSSTKRTKHINVRYYFVKSRIDAGEVIVQWYSGEKLVGDFFSKPLSGSKFLRFRRKIMNHKRLDYCKSSRNEESEDDNNDQNKQGTVLVSVGMKKTMKSGYQKAKHIFLPARQPYRKGPVKSKTGKAYNNKPLPRKYLSNKARKYQPKKVIPIKPNTTILTRIHGIRRNP